MNSLPLTLYVSISLRKVSNCLTKGVRKGMLSDGSSRALVWGVHGGPGAGLLARELTIKKEET